MRFRLLPVIYSTFNVYKVYDFRQSTCKIDKTNAVLSNDEVRP